MLVGAALAIVEAWGNRHLEKSKRITKVMSESKSISKLFENGGNEKEWCRAKAKKIPPKT